MEYVIQESKDGKTTHIVKEGVSLLTLRVYTAKGLVRSDVTPRTSIIVEEYDSGHLVEQLEEVSPIFYKALHEAEIDIREVALLAVAVDSLETGGSMTIKIEKVD